MEARAGTFAASPSTGQYTAGQEITISGTFGVRGRRTAHLQSNLGRPGDIWRDVPGTTTRTNSSGRFTLRLPAHSSQITYRMVSGNRRTSTWTSVAVHQEVTLRAQGAAVAGQQLTLVADTSAMPLLAARAVTLQQRVGTGWATLGGSTLDGAGRATFGVVPAAGTTVYRVRLEDWDQGAGHVGWFPSYPLYVDTAGTAARPAAQARTRPDARAVDVRTAPHQTTAAGSRRWGIQRYDFDWEYGESLTDRAVIGTRRRGQWTDASTGTGRVMMRNGAMHLSSVAENAGRFGSSGSLSSTLTGNAVPYGRWETRLMPRTFLGGSTDYTVTAELVPEADLATGCNARTITLFEARPQTAGYAIGAKSMTGAAWQRTVPGVGTNGAFHAFAVEVTPKKITWFLDGRPVGRVKDSAAVSGEPLTFRLAMTASGTEPMKTTRTLVDWVRSYPTGTGAPSRGGARLTSGTHTTTC